MCGQRSTGREITMARVEVEVEPTQCVEPVDAALLSPELGATRTGPIIHCHSSYGAARFVLATLGADAQLDRPFVQRGGRPCDHLRAHRPPLKKGPATGARQ